MSGNKAVTDHRRQIRNLNALLEVAKVMGKEIQLDSLLHIIVHKTTEVMEAERSSLLLYDEEKDELWSKVAEGIEVKEIRFPAHTGIAGDVIKTRQVVNIPDAYGDPRFNPDVDKHSGFKTKAVLCMPIITSQGKLLGALQVLNKVSGDTFNREDENLLEALVAQVAVALDRAQLVEAFLEKKRIEEALKLAHDIQMGLLPKTFPPFPDKPQIDLHASIIPAKGVCGDFYDFFFVDEDHLCFVIADVSGKGIPAALFMAVSRTLIKTRSAKESPPCQTLMQVNNDLYQQNDSGMFVTIFYGMLNIRTGELTYSNGGHNPPYILRQKQGEIEGLEAGGVALGVMEGYEYDLNTTQLRPGDGIFLFTDGVSEAMDKDGNEFSSERLEELLKNLDRLAPQDITKDALEDVDHFVAGADQSDDITVMVVKYWG